MPMEELNPFAQEVKPRDQLPL